MLATALAHKPPSQLASGRLEPCVAGAEAGMDNVVVVEAIR